MSLLPPDVLKNLQKEYMKNFPEKIARMEKLMEIGDWTGLERECHKFAGSGTTYKMPEISKLSKAIEIFLEKNLPPDPDTIKNALTLFKKVLETRAAGSAMVIDGEEAYKKVL